MINLVRFLSCLFLVGCAHSPSGWNTKDIFLSGFQPTESICVDGLIVNMAAAQCEVVEHQTFENLRTIECLEHSSTSTTGWLNHIFIVVPPYQDELPSGVIPICADPNAILTIVDFKGER
tara:strand:- start:1416 stop:1775 length:360 start_codon:yes stop_codon:yes gene_type:complete